MDDLLDHLGELNDLTPRIKVGASHPVRPEVVFGLDTRLYLRKGEEGVDWNWMGGERGHEDEVETRRVRRGGRLNKSLRVHEHENEHGHGHGHGHGDGCDISTAEEQDEDIESIEPIERETLERALAELNFEIYRGTPYRTHPHR